MADLAQHSSYTAEYSGLLDNLYLTLAIAGACLIGYELEVHIPRRRGRDGTFRRIPARIFLAARGRLSSRKDGVESHARKEVSLEKSAVTGLDGARQKLGDRESWEFGYIFQPKAWAVKPSPPVPRIPLAWIGTALSVKESDMPASCGLDLTLHMRFLRGSFFYVLLQCFTVLPILLPLHVIYSPDTVARTSMLKASITSLVESDGTRWLWVHAILIWWIGITWTATALWIAWGGLGYRRREIAILEEKVKAARKRKQLDQGGEGGGDDAWSVRDDSEGIKRFRTLMVENIPPDMRDQHKLRDYFDFYLNRHRLQTSKGSKTSTDPSEPSMPVKPHLRPGVLRRHRKSPEKAADIEGQAEKLGSAPQGAEDEMADTASSSGDDSNVDEVVLVRKLGAVESLRSRRHDILKQLEVAHVKLAQRILKAVEKHSHKRKTSHEKAGVALPSDDAEKGRGSTGSGPIIKLDRRSRLDALTGALGKYIGDSAEQRGQGDETLWDTLHALPRELLDPYQSLTHMPITSRFRNQNAPLIDYLTTKLSYLTGLLEEARAKPLSSYSASSTAFVTFKDAKTARLALKVLKNHPKRSLACRNSAAPEWTDLLWPRLGKSVYRSEFVRGWVVALGVWVFTLAWIFPVSIFCAIASLSNIAGFIKPLQSWLSANPKASSAITSLAPVILVALLTLAICPILLLIANKAETIVTRLGIHNSVMSRFWKFLMVNGVVFFAIGQTAIEAYLTAFQTSNFDPLPIISSSFPTAAPYFASYILLQVAIQPFFEIFRFGLATIVYVFGTRVSTIPRQRSSRTEFPTFSHFSQVPQQLLAGAIMHLFMLLNPLVIPFSLVFYGALYVVWKRQFTYVYGRLYETNGRRSSVRILRYSMDGLALGQFVLFAFFVLERVTGHAIATGILFFATLIAKLIITRALKRRFDKLDIEEADIMCPSLDGDDDLRRQSEIENEVDLEETRGNLVTDRAEVNLDERSLATQSRQQSSYGRWIGKWELRSLFQRGAPKFDRPIPFDKTFFAFLDRMISFDAPKIDSRSMIPTDTHDEELRHQPDHGIHHERIARVVSFHHPLRAWEDIPPYQRARGYNDQPAYTDDFDDYLWLPRDPLSTLDLDDTVEVRLSITTSAGGSGRIGDWAEDEGEAENDGGGGDRQIVPLKNELESRDRMEPSHSIDATSERHLIQVELPSHIGSEVDDRDGGNTPEHHGRFTGGLLGRLIRRQHYSKKSDEISLTPLSSRRSGERQGLVGEMAYPLDHSEGKLDGSRPGSEGSPPLASSSVQGARTDVSYTLGQPLSPLVSPFIGFASGSQISVPSSSGRVTSQSGVPTRVERISSAATLQRKLTRSQSRRSRDGTGPSVVSSNAVEKALLEEVIAEEKRAAADHEEEEGKDNDLEAKEVEKEKSRGAEKSRKGPRGILGGDFDLVRTRSAANQQE